MTIFPEHDPYELAEQLLKCQSEVKRLRDKNKEGMEQVRVEREKLIGAAQALIDYVHNKYPGEELRCPYMKALEAALVEVKEKI